MRGHGIGRSNGAGPLQSDEEGGGVRRALPIVGQHIVEAGIDRHVLDGLTEQQLAYYAGRALCRRHFPDILLGVFSEDEIAAEGRPAIGADQARDVTPKGLSDRLDKLASSSRQEGSEDAASHDAETGDVTHEADAGAATAEETAIDDNIGSQDQTELAETPREELIHNLRSKMQTNVSILKLLNDLTPQEHQLLTSEDKKELKELWRQFSSRPKS